MRIDFVDSFVEDSLILILSPNPDGTPLNPISRLLSSGKRWRE